MAFKGDPLWPATPTTVTFAGSFPGTQAVTGLPDAVVCSERCRNRRKPEKRAIRHRTARSLGSRPMV